METIKFRDKNPRKTPGSQARYRGPKKKVNQLQLQIQKKLFQKKKHAPPAKNAGFSRDFYGVGLSHKGTCFCGRGPKNRRKKKSRDFSWDRGGPPVVQRTT